MEPRRFRELAKSGDNVRLFLQANPDVCALFKRFSQPWKDGWAEAYEAVTEVDYRALLEGR
jgi:hypothetical protein